jgi:hypothetical protein
MWIVEVNVLGRRFTYRGYSRPGKLRLSPRNLQSRLAHVRHARATAA